ncbi:MAG TPA: GNAT family N-acetyltransferase, partial [Bdellovibrio sp.]|nr:GNAT family N-acetyltransferase [Bdellovibrio sp.]
QQLKQKERQELQDFIKTNLPFTEHLEKALQEPETRILSVRDKEHRLVATALLCSEKDEKTGKREGLIRSVAVDPNFRGQKIAPWLVSYLIQKAKVQGYPSLVLVTYNPTAKKIYEKMGFDLYWGPDQYENVKMRLTLNQPIPANVKQKSSLWERLKEMGSRAIRWSKSLLKAVLRFLHLNQKKKPA